MRLIALLFVLALGAFAQSKIAGCDAFPSNNIWNTPVDKLPVHAQSAAFIGRIGAKAGLRLDDSMPINIVSGGSNKVMVNGIVTPESDPGLYVIPPNVQVEHGSDAHAIVVDKDECILYELFNTKKPATQWAADSAAKWDLNSNALRPEGWTSADAAGLPIMPGILRYEEVLAGHVNHALRVTSPYTKGNSYQWPARHYASHNPDGPQMGQRFRLKREFDTSRYSHNIQVILQGLKTYGLMLSDNGMAWGMEHDADSRWNASEMQVLHEILGSNMEAVDVSSLMSNSDSGIAGSAAGLIVATDALGRPNAVKIGPGLKIVNGALTVSH